MNVFEEKMKRFLKENNIVAEHLSFQESCHSVEEAARVVNALPEDFVKNVCMIDSHENLVVAIVRGNERASATKVGKVLNNEMPRLATPKEILDKTGFPCGGTPSFGFQARFLIDSKVLEKEFVFTGGGSENSLIKISSKELLKASKGEIVNIRKK